VHYTQEQSLDLAKYFIKVSVRTDENQKNTESLHCHNIRRGGKYWLRTVLQHKKHNIG
jgi:hypothetical protein